MPEKKPVPTWEVEGITVSAHTKSEARAVLKRLLGRIHDRKVNRLTAGYGRRIVKREG